MTANKTNETEMAAHLDVGNCLIVGKMTLSVSLSLLTLLVNVLSPRVLATIFLLLRPPRSPLTPTQSSVSSSTFTLSSTTDASSASSVLFDRPGGRRNKRSDHTNVFSAQLKKLYRDITNLENKVKIEDSEDWDNEDSSSSRKAAIVTLKGKEPEANTMTSTENAEHENGRFKLTIINTEYIHDLLEISLASSVPASLRNIPTDLKYNIIVFNKLLELLCRASFTAALALKHLQDFIYDAYTFYIGLLEEPTLSGFKSGWLKALGDLARYRMAVAVMVSAIDEASDGKLKPPKVSGGLTSDKPAARIDESPSPSVGLAGAWQLIIETVTETEHWHDIARDWYAAGLTEQPGTGKFHHHLGLL
ncbi:hypothetical protein H0H92_011938 [Tricholoma furcatifolium]|nr:hypothetical protein H0H92_011938 [Tricholoma furcatifolium]